MMWLMFWLIWQTMPVDAAKPSFTIPQNIPHQLVIQQLRDRGQTQLALDYVESLQHAQPQSPAAEQWLLQYWRARLQLDLQFPDRNITKARQYLQAAETALLTFGKQFPDHPLREEISVWQAELYFDLGRILIIVMNESKDQQPNAPLTQQAFELFSKAEQLYVEQIQKWEPQRASLPKVASSAESKALAQKVYQGLLTGMIGQALCWQELARIRGLPQQTASERYLKSAQLLEKAAGYRDQHPLGWKALAMQAHFSLGLDSRKAEELYQRVLKERRSEAQMGQMYARYYRLIDLLGSARGGRKAQRDQFRQEAETWFNDYPQKLFAPMGQTLRYHLATFLLEDYMELDNTQKQSSQATQQLQRALQMFELVEGSASEWASAAENQFIATWMLLAKNPSPLTAQSSFRECLLQGQMAFQHCQDIAEQLRANRDPKQQPELLKQRDRYFQELHTAAEAAWQRKPKDLRPRDGDRLYSLLFESALRKGDWAAAADWSERLRQQTNNTELARSAASQSLRMIQILAQRDSRAQARLQSLAKEILRDYPQSQAGDMAREVIGLALYQEKKFAQAEQLLSQITPQHDRFALCHFYAGLANWQLHLEMVRSQKQPPEFETPFRKKAFQLMEEAVDAANQISSGNPASQATAMRVNLADLYGRCGQWQRTSQLLAPLIDRIQKREPMPDVSTELSLQILGLALRAEIQQNPTSPATLQLLQLLQTSNTSSALGHSTTDLLRDLGRHLRNQLDQLEKEGPPAQARADQLRKNFGLFLSQVEKIPNRPLDFTYWLAAQFVALGELDNAQSLINAISKPDANAPTQAVQSYQQGSLAWAVSLRQYARNCTDPQKRSKAIDALESSLNQIMQEEWAKKHPAFVRERIMIDQLRGRLVTAIEQWDRLRQALEPHVQRGTMYKELYFDAHEGLIECLHAESKKHVDPETRARLLRRAAQLYLMLRSQEFGGTERQNRMESFLNRPEQADLREMIQQLIR